MRPVCGVHAAQGCCRLGQAAPFPEQLKGHGARTPAKRRGASPRQLTQHFDPQVDSGNSGSIGELTWGLCLLLWPPSCPPAPLLSSGVQTSLSVPRPLGSCRLCSAVPTEALSSDSSPAGTSPAPALLLCSVTWFPGNVLVPQRVRPPAAMSCSRAARPWGRCTTASGTCSVSRVPCSVCHCYLLLSYSNGKISVYGRGPPPLSVGWSWSRTCQELGRTAGVSGG